MESLPDEEELRCRRHGCGKMFKIGDVTTDCIHHAGYPMFHDLTKRWTCCGSESYDWDDFVSIPGCAHGVHSTELPPMAPTSKPASTSTPPVSTSGVTVKSIEEFNKSNEQSKPSPSAVSGEVENIPSKPLVILGGQYKCKNNGCHKDYNPNDNHEQACSYHPGAPIFHDLKKSWSCCKTVTYDFDDFMKLPTCATGPHVPKMVS